MTTTVSIGGEDHTLQDFMAFKALTAMRLVADVEAAFRETMKAGAAFKRQFEEENYVSIPRAEARRQMRPKALSVQVRVDKPDGSVEWRDEPVLDEHGQPVLGPDPLGHLTEEDWQAAANELRIPDSPSDELMMGAMLPKGFALAREQVLRILALVLTSNRDLEKWDTDGEDIDAKLDAAAKALAHRASLPELIRVGVAAMNVCREQVSGPFEEAKAAWAAWRKPDLPSEEPTPPPAPAAASIELPSTDGQRTSSTSSPSDSGGTPEPPSTAPAGA